MKPKCFIPQKKTQKSAIVINKKIKALFLHMCRERVERAFDLKIDLLASQ